MLKGFLEHWRKIYNSLGETGFIENAEGERVQKNLTAVNDRLRKISLVGGYGIVWKVQSQLYRTNDASRLLVRYGMRRVTTVDLRSLS